MVDVPRFLLECVTDTADSRLGKGTPSDGQPYRKSMPVKTTANRERRLAGGVEDHW